MSKDKTLFRDIWEKTQAIKGIWGVFLVQNLVKSCQTEKNQTFSILQLLSFYRILKFADRWTDGHSQVLQFIHYSVYISVLFYYKRLRPQGHLRGGQLNTMTQFFCFKKKKKNFQGVQVCGRVVLPSPKIAINLPITYEKLHYKGELNRISGQRDPSLHTDKRTEKFVFFLNIFCRILLKCVKQG